MFGKYCKIGVLALLLLPVCGYAQATEGALAGTPESVLPDVADNFDGYRARREGDAALSLGDYALAEQLYREYASAALVRGDTQSLQDSSVRLVNLYLQKGDIASAEREIAEFKRNGLDDFVGRALDAEA